jgi:hypothetical protein
MMLEEEQEELLARFVEAHRSAPRDARSHFIATESMGSTQATFIHGRVHGVHFEGSRADAEVLADAGFLRLTFGSRGDPLFYVTPEGIARYEARMAGSSPVAAVESRIREYLSQAALKKTHSAALAKWEQAEQLLWAADSAQQFTTVGHLCREALQEFAASIATQHRVDVSNIDPAKTVSRLRAVVAARANELGTTEKAFLDALIAYWGTLSDLIQRQEHGALREGEVLVWEDGRRVVFQTCVVMYEVSRTLK